MSSYPVPIYLPRRKRIISPGEWLRDKAREREQTVTKAIAFDAALGTVTNAATLTTSGTAASNSRILLPVWWFGTQTVTGASGGGLTWVVDKQFRGTGGGDQNTAVLSADAPGGLASSTNITPTFSATPDFGPGIGAASFTGLTTGASGYLDGTPPAGVDDFSESWLTANIVTANADDLIVGFSVADTTLAHSEIANYTEAFPEWTCEGTQRGILVYRIVSSASTYQAGGTWDTTVAFQQNIGLAYTAGEPAPVATFLGMRKLFTGRRN